MTSGLRVPRTDWRVALRVAGREARRAKGRTALVVALIGLPVVALSFVVATLAMHRLTPQEKVSRLMGDAAAVVAFADDKPLTEPVDLAANGENLIFRGTPHLAAELTALLPAGATVAPLWTGSVRMNTAAGQGDLRAYGIDAGPLTDAMLRVWSGRMPVRPDEIAVSPGALARLGVPVGATVTTADRKPLRIVGTAEVGGSLSDTVIFPAGTRPGDQFGQAWLVGQPAPMLMPEVAALNRHGIMVQSRALILNPPPGATRSGGDAIDGVPTFQLGILAVGLSMVETVLLVGSAFAVGARRRQRDLALVATAGATPAQLRRIMLGDGVVAGALAGVVGLTLGVTTALLARPWIEQHVYHVRSGAYHLDPPALAGVAVLAVVTGTLAAVIPAFTAARVEVVAALAGRRGTIRSKRRWLLLGIAATALGAAGATGGAYRHSSATILGGLVVAELGLVLCTPAIVGLVARLGRHLPAAPRMALRDASRRRAAAAPAISAVMAAVAGSIAVTVYLGSATQQQRGTYMQSAPIGTIMLRGAPADQLTAAVHDVLPGARVVAYQTYACRGSAASCDAPLLGLRTPADRLCPYLTNEGPLTRAQQARARADHRCDEMSINITGDPAPMVTDDPAVVAAATGLSGTGLADAVATLRAGGVLTGDAHMVEDGHATISGPRQISVPAYVVRTGVGLYYPIVSPPVLAAEGFVAQDLGVIVTPAGRPDQRVTDALTAAVGRVRGASFYIENGPSTNGSPVGVILAIAAGIVALGAAGIATGLAAADSRRDLATLAAVGAGPWVRRTMSLAQSGIIAGLGSLIGAAAGFAAAAAILTGLNQVNAGAWPAPKPYPIEVPWLNLAVAVVVVPLLAMGAAGLLTRSRIPAERRAD